MKDFKENSIKKYRSAWEFINSYITGNESTDGQPYPAWSIMLSSIISLMRAGGLDSEDIINGLEDDLQIIDHFLEMEETDEGITNTLRDVTGEMYPGDGIKWLLEHAEARGQEILRLQKENDELKESIRTITNMGKEEPYERVERLLEDVQTLTTQNRKLEYENESTHEELLIEKQRMSMLSASFEMLEYQKNVLEGEVKQANFILKMLCK